MNKSLFALSLGTLGLGMSEFGIMSILTPAAQSLGVSIPVAGHLISAYALGVSAGALLLALIMHGKALKKMLLYLILLATAGNLGAVFASDYSLMLLARFISGFPHGAYFGISGIIAKKIAPPGKETEAVSIMIAGMTVANLIGIPAGTYIAHVLSWHYLFLIVVVCFILTFFAVGKWIPVTAPLPDKGFKSQFRFLKTAGPWILFFAIILGNSGVFAWYSYINPFMLNIAGFSSSSMAVLMTMAGLGMVIGNLLGGRYADKFSPLAVTMVLQLGIAVVLGLVFFAGNHSYFAVFLMFLCTAGLFGMSGPQQVLMINHAKGGEILGASGAQIGFNLGNALGAAVGGLPLLVHYDYEYTALPGIVLAFCGFLLLLLFHHKYAK